MSNRPGYIRGLDGLRAIAALSVFGVHFQQQTNFDGGQIGPLDVTQLLLNGNTGVGLFFILSGFLLGVPHWQAIYADGARVPLSAYYARRLARIVPAYYICLTALIVSNKYWLESDALRDIALHYTFLYNFFDDTFYSLNPPFWTIGIEVQFYILLPFVFLLLARLPANFALTVIVATIVGAYAAHFWLLDQIDNPGPSYTRSLLAHLPHFMMGVAGSWLFVTRRAASIESSTPVNFFNDVLFWGALLMVIVILGTSLDQILSVPHGRYNLPLVPLLLVCLILAAPRAIVAGWMLEAFPLRLLGVISYGIYIYHLPVMHVAGRLMRRLGVNSASHWPEFIVVSFVVTVIIASASYLFLERPILNAVRRSAR